MKFFFFFILFKKIGLGLGQVHRWDHYIWHISWSNGFSWDHYIWHISWSNGFSALEHGTQVAPKKIRDFQDLIIFFFINITITSKILFFLFAKPTSKILTRKQAAIKFLQGIILCNNFLTAFKYFKKALKLATTFRKINGILIWDWYIQQLHSF